MSERVVTVMGDGGTLVAIKHGGTAHEARILDIARHPGVVDLVGYADDDGTASTVTTVLVGTQSLATVGRLPPERVAGIIAALAATVADLHDLGLVHGRIEPTHVLLGAGGRPVLCGFSGAGRAGDVPPPTAPVAAAFADPAVPPAAPLAPSTDVYGLGALLRWLVEGGDAAMEPIPDHRLGLSRVRPGWIGWLPRALLNLADQATADDPRFRPTARSFAVAVNDTAPEARLDEPPQLGRSGRGAGDRASPRRRLVVVATVVAAAGLLVSGAWLLGRSPASPPPSVVEFDGGVVEVDGTRYAVGVAGDELMVGDWDCDGRATLAVLRPATGAVFVFPGWAEPGRDLTVDPIATVDSGRRLLAADGPSGCPRLVVERADGERVEVAT